MWTSPAVPPSEYTTLNTSHLQYINSDAMARPWKQLTQITLTNVLIYFFHLTLPMWHVLDVDYYGMSSGSITVSVYQVSRQFIHLRFSHNSLFFPQISGLHSCFRPFTVTTGQRIGLQPLTKVIRRKDMIRKHEMIIFSDSS